MIDFEKLEEEKFMGKKTETSEDGVITTYHFVAGVISRKNNFPAITTSDNSRTEYHAWLSFKEYGRHREDHKPAIILKDKEGNVTFEAYYENDQLHNLYDAAEIKDGIPVTYAIEGRKMSKEQWEREAPAAMFNF